MKKYKLVIEKTGQEESLVIKYRLFPEAVAAFYATRAVLAFVKDVSTWVTVYELVNDEWVARKI